MKTIILAIAGALLLAGCTSITAPVLAGPNTYMIGAGSHGGLSSDADLLAQTIKTAGAFCTQQGRVVQVVSTSSSGTQGWTPQSNEVLFKCILAPAE